MGSRGHSIVIEFRYLLGAPYIGVSTFLYPPGTSKADDGTLSREKFDFCVVVSIRTALDAVCDPSAAGVVELVVSAGAGFLRWKPPSAEPPNADPKSPPTELFELAGGVVAAGVDACAEFCEAPGPFPLPPMRVTSMTLVP